MTDKIDIRNQFRINKRFNGVVNVTTRINIHCRGQIFVIGKNPSRGICTYSRCGYAPAVKCRAFGIVYVLTLWIGKTSFNKNIISDTFTDIFHFKVISNNFTGHIVLFFRTELCHHYRIGTGDLRTHDIPSINNSNILNKSGRPFDNFTH